MDKKTTISRLTAIDRHPAAVSLTTNRESHIMEFVIDLLCELPFMLNLPNGTYECMVNGANFELEVLQEHVALHFSERNFAIEPPERLKALFGKRFETLHKQQLRTLLRHRTKSVVQEHELPTPTDQQLEDEMMASIIGESPMRFANDTDGLKGEAIRRVAALTASDREAFLRLVSRKLHTKKMPDFLAFLTGVNSLVRLYMQRFGDFFVEEVAVQQLASQSPLQGIYVQITCDGELIHHYGIVGRIPPIMRQPWLNHPVDQIDRFKADLARGAEPDPVSLLGVRARAFLQRGAFRSGIIEASAAMDLALTRKIREGLHKLGKPDNEIDAMLRQPRNQRFDERAKRILKEATGVSAPQFDNVLWERVSAHRATHRQGVAHADREPDPKEAEQVVEDFLSLAERIKNVVPEIDIRRAAYLKWETNGCRDGHDLDDWLAAEIELLAAQKH